MLCCNRQLKSHHAAVLINLCIALIIANIVFLAGANRVDNKVSVVSLSIMMMLFIANEVYCKMQMPRAVLCPKSLAEFTGASIRVAYIIIFRNFYLFYSKSFKKVTIVSLKHFATVLRTSGEVY